MNVIMQLAKRNAKIYLRDKTSVFFSFLAIIIIIFLYGSFLADVQVESIESMIGYEIENARWLVDSWIIAGILVVNAVTIPLAIMAQMSEDFENKRIYDLYSAPIKKYQIILSYLLSAWYVGVVMGIINLIVGEIYILLAGGKLVPLINFIPIIGMIIISVVFFSSLSFFIMSFVKSSKTAGTVNSIFGTFIGFVGGIYIPIKILSTSIQNLVLTLPYSYAGAIFRRLFMAEPIEQVFEGAPKEALNSYKDLYGYNLYIGDHSLSSLEMVLIIMGIGIIFYILTLLKFRKAKAIN